MNDLEGWNDNDSAPTASAAGILQCLKFLAAEAASLKLLHTLSAIEDALEMAARESGMDHVETKYDIEPLRPVIH